MFSELVLSVHTVVLYQYWLKELGGSPQKSYPFDLMLKECSFLFRVETENGFEHYVLIRRCCVRSQRKALMFAHINDLFKY